MTSSPKRDPKPRGLTLLSQCKSVILECFGHTTAHGYGRLAEESSPLRKIFWFLACATAFGIFAQQFHDITVQYMARPLKTRMRIEHEQKLPFPQVTICNLNMIRHSRVPDNIKQRFPAVFDREKRVSTNRSSGKKGILKDRSNHRVINLNDYPAYEKLAEEVHQVLAEQTEETLMGAGHQLDDLVLNCRYQSMECLEDLRDLWTHFWHPKFGNCYTFNKGKDEFGMDTTVMTSSSPGKNGGLNLELNIEQEEYVSQISHEAGVRLFIGKQNEMPLPYEMGISVSPGFATSIMLRKVQIGRLDPFENRSCETSTNVSPDSIFHRYNISYSMMACKISCITKIIHQHCDCVLYKMNYHKKPVCNIGDQTTVDCVNKAYVRYDNGECDHDCREECREDTFKMTLSLTKWPSKHFESELRKDIEEHTKTNITGPSSDQFLKVRIYYGELNYEVIEEEYAYTMASFLSDIGGLMGMWIGISILTCVEVLELMTTLCITLIKSLRKNKDQVVEIQPKDSPA